MKPLPGKRDEIASAAITQTLLGIFLCSAVFTLAASGADPSWWSSPGSGSQPAVAPQEVVTNDGVVSTNYVPSSNGVVVQGQLKQFTARAVDEMNASLPGGAGTNLNSMVSNWAQDYATNDYGNTTNPYAPYKPGDFTAMNVGQLKQIGKMVWSPLVAAGYTNALPSWLATSNAADLNAAVIGQLKTVFNFDLAPYQNTVTDLSAILNNDGSVTLSWLLPSSGNGNVITVGGVDENGNASVIEVVSADTTSVTLTLAQLQGLASLGASNASLDVLVGLQAAAIHVPTPLPPSGLTGYADDSGNMNLSWTPPPGAASSYYIERETVTSGIWSHLTTISTATGGTGTYQDTTYLGSVWGGYRYRVSTISGTSTSSPSGEYPLTQYAVIDLGAQNTANFINNKGQVVLNAQSSSPQFWDQGATTNIYDPTGQYIFNGEGNEGSYQPNGVYGLNNNGLVVGTCDNTEAFSGLFDTAASRGILWTKANGLAPILGEAPSLGSIPLPPPSQSYSYFALGLSGNGINDVDDVVGSSQGAIYNGNSELYASLLSGVKTDVNGFYAPFGDSFILLAYPYDPIANGPQETILFPQAINNSDLVIGNFKTYQSNTGTFDAINSYIDGVNQGNPDPISSDGMVWDGSLHPLGGFPVALNNAKQIIGNSQDEDGQMVMWQGAPNAQNPNQTDYNPVYMPGGPNNAAEFAIPVAMNTASLTLTGTNGQNITVPATQVITPNRIWTMSAPTGTATTGTFSLPQGINDMLPESAGWSGFNGHAINDLGAIVGTASYSGTNTATFATGAHGVMLLPLQLVNLADPYQGSAVINNPSHIVNGAPQSTQIDLSSAPGSIDINGVAWISAQDPTNNNGPGMPHLQASIAAPSGTTVWWKLSVIFHSQMNPSQPYRDFDPSANLSPAQIAQLTNSDEWADYSGPVGGMIGYSDNIAVPFPTSSQDGGVVNGWVPIPAGTPWNIYQDPDWQTAVAAGFFGGDAELSVKITNSDGTITILPEQDFYFRIAGENPTPTACENYINQQYNGGQPATSPQRWTGLSFTLGTTPPAVPGYWFAYAIAKEETVGDGGNRPYYNNFMDNGGQLVHKSQPWPGHEGRPDWNNDDINGDTLFGTGGYGLFQLTFQGAHGGQAAEPNFIMQRNWIWNWQSNVQAFLPIIQEKLKFTQLYLNYEKNQNMSSPFPDPSALMTNASSTSFNFWESSVITLNNAGSFTVGPRDNALPGVWRFTPALKGAPPSWRYVPNGRPGYLYNVAHKGIETPL